MAPPSEEALRSLDALVKTAATLLTQLQDTLSDIQKDASSSPPPLPPAPTPAAATSDASSAAPLDALAIAHDSATLIRAHATKISLLIINEPFSATALTPVVRDLLSAAAPALVAAAQSCDSRRHTALVRRELAHRCARVLAELRALLLKIPTADGRALTSGVSGGKEASIQVTGILWSACDDLVALVKGGPAGLLADKARQCEDLLRDVLEELKEWGEEEPEDDDDDDDEDGDEDVSDDEHASANDAVDDLADDLGNTRLDSAQDIIDDLMSAQNSIPRTDPSHIRPRLESTLKRLRLVTLLCAAARVRRFAKLSALSFSSSSSSTSTNTNSNTDASAAALPPRLDSIAHALDQLPARFEDLAAALYDLDPSAIDAGMRTCFDDARALAALLAKDWTGADDAFSPWIQRFQTEMDAPSPGSG